MTEREKMLAGLPYDCGDKELLEQWHKAKNLIRDYNLANSEDRLNKSNILEQLLGGYGDNVVIGAGSIVTSDIPIDTIAYGNPCRVIRKNI